LLLSLLPSPLTTLMMASAMPAAIRPYSIAVAPDSSANEFLQRPLRDHVVLSSLRDDRTTRKPCADARVSVASTLAG
jgi:hypothetical protein